MKNLIAIISGEPESVNSEIIVKSWRKISQLKRRGIFVIGSFSLIQQQLKKIKLNAPLRKVHSIEKINSSKEINIFDVPIAFKNPFKISPKLTSRYIITCLDIAHHFAVNKKIKGFVNCAIDKRRVFNSNFGVTEFLAKKNKLKSTVAMLIYNEKYSVVPTTTHIKINSVSKNLTKKVIEDKINTIYSFYVKVLKKEPTIAVLGLNPHNNELNTSSEENRIIIPVLKKLKKRKIRLIGPYPADTIFNNFEKYKFNVILGMYHDQVLAPFKALFGFNAINITIGLNYLRVSPDHGTAKDMIGKNKAEFQSLTNSISFIYQNDIT
jgi:4-hydroxy-L-threonine phosphate dehydrogenase PdxA